MQATDISLAWVSAILVFGSSHPAVNYLLLLAIIDDAIGLVIIAVRPRSWVLVGAHSKCSASRSQWICTGLLLRPVSPCGAGLSAHCTPRHARGLWIAKVANQAMGILHSHFGTSFMGRTHQGATAPGTGVGVHRPIHPD